MKALKIEPGKAPKRIDIDNTLEALQNAVGGYIEVIYLNKQRPACLICNEEGKLSGLPMNRALYAGDKPCDIICGMDNLNVAVTNMRFSKGGGKT